METTTPDVVVTAGTAGGDGRCNRGEPPTTSGLSVERGAFVSSEARREEEWLAMAFADPASFLKGLEP